MAQDWRKELADRIASLATGEPILIAASETSRAFLALKPDDEDITDREFYKSYIILNNVNLPELLQWLDEIAVQHGEPWELRIDHGADPDFPPMHMLFSGIFAVDCMANLRPWRLRLSWTV